MNGFIFDNWPGEYKYLKKEILLDKFEDVIYLCVKDEMTFKDMINLFEKTFLRVMDLRFPHESLTMKADLSGVEHRKYRSMRYKHKLVI